MMNRQVSRERQRGAFALSAIAAAVVSTFMLTSAYAQEEEQAAPAAEQEQAAPTNTPAPAPADTDIETIVVTGSRLRSATADSPSPIQVISGEDIAKSGVVNIQDLLLKNPVFGTPALSRTNSNFLTSGAGVATIDLRNLGSDRTLVLVNGRRFVSGLPGSAAVDLNTIPADFIDRVEILTGGASAVYGSDAVAGVVNIITKKDFNGLTLDVQKGQTFDYKDDKKDKISLTAGTTSADGRSNIMAHFGYSKQGAVYGKRRPGNAVDNTPLIYTGAAQGLPSEVFQFVSPTLSSYAPEGNIFFTESGCVPTADDDCSRVASFDANNNLIDGPGAGFNRQDYRLLAVPTERYLFATSGEFGFAEKHKAFFEGTFAQTQVRSELEPFPFDDYSTTGTTPNGYTPAEFNVNGTVLTNPFIPDALLARMTDQDGDGLRDYNFSKRLVGIGARGSAVDRDTFRIVTGFKGDLIRDWTYETYVGYGVTKETQISSGQVNVQSLRQALEAIPDVDDIDGDGDKDEAICRDQFARAQGCVPVSVFGYNSITPEAAAYISAPTAYQSFTSQQSVGGSVAGTLVDLPAGPLGMAFGLEYRDEYSRSEFDALQQAGLNAGNKIPRTEGSFFVKEAYLELKAPLLADMPGVYALNVGGAVRVGDYSSVGKVFSYSTNLEYSPIRDLRFRGTVSQATRAPNITELYAPPGQDYPSVTDPCAGITNADIGTTAERCRAAPGVQSNIDANGEFTLNTADNQGVSGFAGGNPDLDEEVGKSYTIGLVWQPSSIDFLSKASFEFDYYNIKITDAIIQLDFQSVLNQCYSGDASFCDYITRRPADVGSNSAGSLEFVNSATINSGELEARGFDFTANWADRVGPGQLSSRLVWSHLINQFLVELSGLPKNEIAGEIGAAKDKFSLTLGYDWGDWSVQTLTTYIGKSYLDDQFWGESRVNSVAPRSYTSLQIGYTWNIAQFYVGVDNLFDTKPPRADTNGLLPDSSTGAGTWADVYDALGQRWYAGVKLNF
jgi:outer membrane receptor protein involved in Fe transport